MAWSGNAGIQIKETGVTFPIMRDLLGDLRSAERPDLFITLWVGNYHGERLLDYNGFAKRYHPSLSDDVGNSYRLSRAAFGLHFQGQVDRQG
jgi:hypothetical protein